MDRGRLASDEKTTKPRKHRLGVRALCGLIRGEIRMTNDEASSNDRMTKGGLEFVIPSSLDICHSSFSCE